MRYTLLCLIVSLVTTMLPSDGLAAAPDGKRTVLRLDGTWEIAEGSMEAVPTAFNHRVQVPGLADLAKPAFTEVGIKSAQRQAFWYRTTFAIKGAVPATALLKVHKARYGTKVFLNGQALGESLPNFTPSYHDLRQHLKPNGQANELVIRVGAFRDANPPSIASGWDFELTRYVPGIYDSVDVILTGGARVEVIQTVPDVVGRKVRVVAELVNATNAPATFKPTFTVRERASGKQVATASGEQVTLAVGETKTAEASMALPDCKLWSPESPFLYEAVVATPDDQLTARFGMRSFRLDPKTGHALLNEKPYFLRGTNLSLYRFLEDPERQNLPWSESWVRALHLKFKDMNWNAARYYNGFPPERWYEIADELGILIQDEFPIWHNHIIGAAPPELTGEALAVEFKAWMRERWNHPCVVIWDAQNESLTPATLKAIRLVRDLDLSNRPWDNGWEDADRPTDVLEYHPYVFQKPEGRITDLAKLLATHGDAGPKLGTRAAIINEYDWLWLNRDGSATELTRQLYDNILGPGATVDQRRKHYARYMATVTEFWRAKRSIAGIMYYSALNYCRPGGYTSDQWIDVANLVMEPHFETAMRDAMAPVGLSIGWWQDQASPSEKIEFPVAVVNDTDAEWNGEVRMSVIRNARTLHTETKPIKVGAIGRSEVKYALSLPAEAGEVDVIASLYGPDGKAVRSVRPVKIGGGTQATSSAPPAPAALTPEQQKAKTIQDATGVGKRD